MAARRPPTPKEYATAVHEAAHCAAAWYHGYRVLFARICPEGIGNEAGHFLFDDGDDRTDGDAWHFEHLEAQAVIFLAGGVAHIRVPGAGLTWAECGADLARVTQLTTSERQLHKLKRRAERLVTKLWRFIEALADQLLVSRRMDQSQIHAVLNGELRRLQALARRGGVS
jgi:hypothetical protein